MSYVDAFYNRDKDIVQVVERVKGKRVYNDFPAWRTFYIKDPRGEYTSIHGEKVRQIKCKRLKDLHKERRINSGKKFYESDLKPEVRCLSENYNGVDSPKLEQTTSFNSNRLLLFVLVFKPLFFLPLPPTFTSIVPMFFLVLPLRTL